MLVHLLKDKKSLIGAILIKVGRHEKARNAEKEQSMSRVKVQRLSGDNVFLSTLLAEQMSGFSNHG